MAADKSLDRCGSISKRLGEKTPRLKEDRLIVHKLPKAPRWSLFLLIPCLLLCGHTSAAGRDRPPGAAIATAHPLATEAGFQALNRGGNAFDAAVAVSAALAVVEPYSSGLGGGGFWLLHRASDGRQVMIDGRERAPLAAEPGLYYDPTGQLQPGRLLDGPLAAGIPGEPAALAHLSQHYGRLPLAVSLEPAVRLARDGFPVDEQYRQMAGARLDAIRQSSAARSQFLVNGDVPPDGYLLRQTDLAGTLMMLGEHGVEGFYTGPVARRLVQGVRHADGVWTGQDLADYRIIEREPVVGTFTGWRIVSAAPPSSGGVALVQMLNMLQAVDRPGQGHVARAHLLTEIMRRAYRDRGRYLGDPDHIDIPMERLLSPHYGAGLVRGLDRERATASQSAGTKAEGTDTTHFSIIDGEGNRVAATLSINYPFGSCFVVPGTGVLLNDEMDDFAVAAGVPNAYGLVSSEANVLAPGRRMLSSMTPTFLESPEAVVILGTPGGSRIITMVLHGALAAMAGQPLSSIVSAPRFHHQYLPDLIQHEPGAFSAEERRELEARGHTLKQIDGGYGNMQMVSWDRGAGTLDAASDPRGGGEAGVQCTDYPCLSGIGERTQPVSLGN